MRILLVEDERYIGAAHKVILNQYYYTVDVVTDDENMFYALKTGYFSVVILNNTQLGKKRFDTLKRLRKFGNDTPFLVISDSCEHQDRIYALNECGANDYLCKPFSIEELLVRLGLLIKGSGDRRDDTIVSQNVSVSVNAHKVWVAEEEVLLTPTEFKLLVFFMSNLGKVLNKSKILEHLHGWDIDSGFNSVEVHIFNLRKKMPGVEIKNVRGVGYLIDR
ncbi:response regulator transcription factor [Vibrio ostreicida]|uniref:response regulator transcription factor n=1 Tax=Vibrio ostreicida TaxID=526588 RepID=UPI000970D9A9|nr:response regulator transcription factor [Vibrio ostreicida]